MQYILFGFSLLMALLCIGTAAGSKVSRFDRVFGVATAYLFVLIAFLIWMGGTL